MDKPATRRYDGIMKLVLLAALCVSLVAILDATRSAGRQAKTPSTNATSALVRGKDFDFKPIKIVPSPYEGIYIGHFSFINRTSTPVSVTGFDEPENGKFLPRFVGYEVLQKEEWKDAPSGEFCGTGLMSYEMKPQVSYEFIVPLVALQYLPSPSSVRISVGEFRSEPFEIDRKKDEKAGAFIAAKKARFAEVRAAFEKAGFKREMIQGDDFCQRLIESLAKPTKAGNGHGFAEMTGIEVFTPEIEFNGVIAIRFRSTNREGAETHYNGRWWINPNKFTPQWFRQEAGKHIKLSSAASTGQEMELDDGSNFWSQDVKLFLSIEYRAPTLPADDDAKAVFLKMLGNLEQWLNETPDAQVGKGE